LPRAKKQSAEEIIPNLRAAELEIAKGRTAAEATKIGVTQQTYYCCEKEHARLKRLLADAQLDKAILKEAPSGNF
jgi:DNA-binding XRE family transcriptional regulator